MKICSDNSDNKFNLWLCWLLSISEFSIHWYDESEWGIEQIYYDGMHIMINIGHLRLYILKQ